MKIKSIKKVKLDEPKQYYDVINAYPYNNFLIKTNTNYICSHNCLMGNFSDEVNWGLTTDTEKLKKKYKSLISQIDARMKSRFMRTLPDGSTYLPTLNIIASSKNNEQSFLDSFIQTKKINESKTTLIVDEPQWVVDSRKDNKVKFFVAIGNKFLANELLPLTTTEEDLKLYKQKGYSILPVPIGYYENFQDNLDGSLMDIAGIASQSTIKYISGMIWNAIKVDTYENPFTKEIIEVGTNDELSYGDFFDITKVPVDLKNKPLFVHLDMSKSGDKTGIAGVYVIGKRTKVKGENSTSELHYKTAFNVSIKAPKGHEISFDKNRQFIRWLKEKGFKIKGVSADSYNSAQIGQQLTADGFKFKTISVDIVDNKAKVCLPYAYFKSTLTDKRIQVYSKCDFLTEEVLGLEREGNGKIEHPEQGTQGSKDSIDAIVGALWHSNDYADQFAYDYGENLVNILDVNLDPAQAMQNQLTVNMNEALKEVLMQNYLSKSPQKQENNGLLQSKGILEDPVKANIDTMMNIANGILVW